MTMELFYKIRLEAEEFAGLLAALPAQFSVAVYATLDQQCYLIDASTKAIFDEHGVTYELEDVCPRYSIAHMRLKFFKKGHRRQTEVPGGAASDEAA
ncbi:MAG: hypothetical protein HUU25_09700 [Candidatus Sumerlaeia bacterium]|nr:hypothetical protein [Candidatus Sumerlaeia bacterium]